VVDALVIKPDPSFELLLLNVCQQFRAPLDIVVLTHQLVGTLLGSRESILQNHHGPARQPRAQMFPVVPQGILHGATSSLSFALSSLAFAHNPFSRVFANSSFLRRLISVAFIPPATAALGDRAVPIRPKPFKHWRRSGLR